MNRKIIFLVATVFIVFILAGASLAATEAYDLSWWTVDGGGGASGNGNYTLQATIGQPDAGYQMSGGDYTLAGGFWGAGGEAPEPTGHQLYLPLINRQ